MFRTECVSPVDLPSFIGCFLAVQQASSASDVKRRFEILERRFPTDGSGVKLRLGRVEHVNSPARNDNARRACRATLDGGAVAAQGVACILECDPKKPGLLTFDNPCDCKRIAGMMVPASRASQFDHRHGSHGFGVSPLVEQAHAETGRLP